MANKALLAFTLLPLCLASCGAGGHLGTYSFQLGKTRGAHASASIKLTDEDFVSNNQTLGKKCTLYGEATLATADSSESSVASSSVVSQALLADSSEEVASSVEESSAVDGGDDSLISLIYDIAGEGLTIPGYYKLGDTLDSGAQQLHLGCSLDFLKELFDITVELDPATIEMFVFSTIDARSIYLRIPVSLQDLTFQLYWYGLDLDTMESVTEHARGTHPTKADIEKINETYPAEHDGKKFRDYYVFSLSLIKE